MALFSDPVADMGDPVASSPAAPDGIEQRHPRFQVYDDVARGFAQRAKRPQDHPYQQPDQKIEPREHEVMLRNKRHCRERAWSSLPGIKQVGL